MDILQNSIIHELVIQISSYRHRIKYCEEMSVRDKNRKKKSLVMSSF